MSETINVENVRQSMAGFADPETGRDVLQTEQIRDLQVDGQRISMVLELTTYSAPVWQTTKQALEEKLHGAFPTAEVHVELATHHRPPQAIGEVGLTAKSVIAVGSGKGGVGKSTIATAIAVGLNRAGCKVGLMDADVYGPSIPHLLGLEGRPEIVEKRIQPNRKGDMAVMSMGFLMPPDEAVIWRGPMLHGAITQFLRDTAWGELDYLIIDMPPGTGDIALTLSQLLPLTGAVVVCTPQDVALLDAVKAIAMFRKVNIPILGLVENMSGFACPGCDKVYDIFGKGGAKQRATSLEVPVLAEVPIDIAVRQRGDAGQMTEAFETESGAVFTELCRELVAGIASRNAAAPPMPTLPVL